MVARLPSHNLSCFLPSIADVQCYGRDCYPAVFGINTVLIIVAFRKSFPDTLHDHLCFDKNLNSGVVLMKD